METTQGLVESVNLDSLLTFIGELSGELPVFVDDSVLVAMEISEGMIDSAWVADSLIKLPNRVHWANDAATAYLVRKLQGFGFDSVQVDAYPTHDRYPETKNVLAFKPGTDGQNGPVWLLGAHYDSVLPAPGADDNGSGTAAVLEAARVLAHAETEAAIIFGFWDTEEAGLIGSDLFAERAYNEGMRIDGVFNLDMIGWDGDLDRAIVIHADEPAVWLAEFIDDVADMYQFDVYPFLAIPGLGRSDHVSFRKWGFPAVLLIEEIGDDFNPYYHTKDDVIGQLDTGFFLEVVKLAITTVAELALSGTAVAVVDEMPDPGQPKLLSIFPNPVRDALSIQYRLTESGPGQIIVTDLLGRTIAAVDIDAHIGELETTQWTITPRLPNGMYFLTLQAKGVRDTKPIFVVR